MRAQGQVGKKTVALGEREVSDIARTRIEHQNPLRKNVQQVNISLLVQFEAARNKRAGRGQPLGFDLSLHFPAPTDLDDLAGFPVQQINVAGRGGLKRQRHHLRQGEDRFRGQTLRGQGVAHEPAVGRIGDHERFFVASDPLGKVEGQIRSVGIEGPLVLDLCRPDRRGHENPEKTDKDFMEG